MFKYVVCKELVFEGTIKSPIVMTIQELEALGNKIPMGITVKFKDPACLNPRATTILGLVKDANVI